MTTVYLAKPLRLDGTLIRAVQVSAIGARDQQRISRLNFTTDTALWIELTAAATALPSAIISKLAARDFRAIVNVVSENETSNSIPQSRKI